MPLAGLVLNRVHTTRRKWPVGRVGRLPRPKTLEAAGDEPLAAAVLRVHAERMTPPPGTHAAPNSSTRRIPA